MKKRISKLITFVLAFCLCLSLAPTVLSDKSLTVGTIDFRASSVEQPDGSYKVTYSAKMTMQEELAKAAAIYRSDSLMGDLMFVCTIADEMVIKLTSVSEEDVAFTCVKWDDKDIFVYDKATILADSVKLQYKLNPEVLKAWQNAPTADIKEALMKPMTITASKIVSAEMMEGLSDVITSTAKVEIQGAGMSRYFGQYTVLAANGTTTVDDGTDLGACPRNELCPAGHFVDLDLQLWYHDGIHYCAEHGLMLGTGLNIFDPDISITRGMVVTVLYRMDKTPAVSGEAVYDDVSPDAWYGAAVEWGDANGVVNGYGNGKFGPDDPITREQMAAMLYRYAKYKGVDVSAGETADISDYIDADKVSEYAIPAVKWACANGLITGYEDHSLRSGAQTRRCEAAALFQRYCLNVIK